MRPKLPLLDADPETLRRGAGLWLFVLGSRFRVEWEIPPSLAALPVPSSKLDPRVDLQQRLRGSC